ncbi:MAG: NAD-dependent epimerase/dehydratase family protein [Bryobacteraceae bacterium]
MNRRRFLQSGGLAGVPLAAAQSPARKPLLITSAGSDLARKLAAGLSAQHAIRLTERKAVRVDHDFVECALGHDSSTNDVVRGVQAIVHVAEPLPDDTAGQQIDLTTRCTYNLLFAAAAEGVPLVVLLSSLEVMSGYDVNLTVSESWRPRPVSAEPRVLAKHLVEFTSREFAREGKVTVVVLRLGKVVRSEEVKDRPFDPTWVDERDVVHAVSLALASRPGRFQVFHIQADSPKARFAVTRARNALKYRPQYQW